MKYLFDLIVPLYNAGGKDFPYRQENLKKIISNTPKNINIVLVEQVFNEELELISDVISQDTENINLIIKTYNGPFCKGWLYNVGVKNSITENIILGECDCWAEDKDFYLRLLKWVKKNKYKWAFAWNSLKKERTNRSPVFLKPKRGGSEGGLVFFDKKFYWSIGGHNEGGMRDLGAIDCEIIRRAEFIQKGYPQFPRTIVHGKHSWSKLKGTSRSRRKPSKHYAINKKIYKMTCSNPKREINRLKKYNKESGGDKPLYEKHTLYNFVKLK